MDMLFKWLPGYGNFKLCFFKFSGVFFFFSEYFLPIVGGTHWGRTHGCEEWVHCPWLTVSRINNTTKCIEWHFLVILCFFRELTNPYSTKFLVDKMVEPIGFPDGLDEGSLNKKEVKGVFETFVLGCYKAQAAFSWDGEGCEWRRICGKDLEFSLGYVELAVSIRPAGRDGEMGGIAMSLCH